jgi:phenylacetate-CoA ligase
MDSVLSKYLLYYPVTTLKGEFVFRYMGQYRRFQWLSPDAIRQYQLDQVRRLIKAAIDRSPHYREVYAQSGVSVDSIRSLDDLRSLPSLSKQDLIANRERMSIKVGGFVSEKTTGGSTGEPVRLLKTATALARERAATWRAYEWAGVNIGDPQGRFWGVPHVRNTRILARITDFVANRRRLSAFNITPASLGEYLEELRRFRPVWLYGYVSAIEALADHMLLHGLAAPGGLKCVITTSEVLTPGVREKIARAFGVRVYNEYGCGEVGSIAHECEHGRMHLMEDNLIVEVDAPQGQPGELVVTDLYNLATPLIRYRLGDFGTIDGTPCPCGRGLSVLGSVHGRAYDLVRTPSGKRIHPEAVIYIFENIQARTAAFRQFQVIQTALDEMLVRLIPSGVMSTEDCDLLIAALKREISTEIRYRIEMCTSLEREKSGKMRVVKSALDR